MKQGQYEGDTTYIMECPPAPAGGGVAIGDTVYASHAGVRVQTRLSVSGESAFVEQTTWLPQGMLMVEVQKGHGQTGVVVKLHDGDETLKLTGDELLALLREHGRR